ncbi:(RS)-norcoclaurine 6-O-methyltransferase-like [Nymphaea colorata]|nr:(RS)-norcoclaurine 6-O-methyltransferase-like [Nymphaea colorata]
MPRSPNVPTGVFAEEQKRTSTDEVLYALIPVSWLLRREVQHNLSALTMLSLHPLIVSTWDNLAAWLQSGEGNWHRTAFEAKHGGSLWFKASLDPKINRLFNEAMSSMCKLFMGCKVERYIVVQSAYNVRRIKVNPSGVQEVMHDWDNGACVKILMRCKEAVPKLGGKVIVVEIVRKKWPQQVFNELQLVLDLHMMVMNNGKECNEEEWKKLFIDAGFSSYEILTSVGILSLIEVFP